MRYTSWDWDNKYTDYQTARAQEANNGSHQSFTAIYTSKNTETKNIAIEEFRSHTCTLLAYSQPLAEDWLYKAACLKPSDVDPVISKTTTVDQRVFARAITLLDLLYQRNELTNSEVFEKYDAFSKNQLPLVIKELGNKVSQTWLAHSSIAHL